MKFSIIRSFNGLPTTKMILHHPKMMKIKKNELMTSVSRQIPKCNSNIQSFNEFFLLLCRSFNGPLTTKMTLHHPKMMKIKKNEPMTSVPGTQISLKLTKEHFLSLSWLLTTWILR